jgi:hypothetical protein
MRPTLPTVLDVTGDSSIRDAARTSIQHADPGFHGFTPSAFIREDPCFIRAPSSLLYSATRQTCAPL